MRGRTIVRFLRRWLVRLFGTVYTKEEMIHLVNRFLEEVRTGRLDVLELRDAPCRTLWCLHLEVAFEKYDMRPARYISTGQEHTETHQ